MEQMSKEQLAETIADMLDRRVEVYLQDHSIGPADRTRTDWVDMSRALKSRRVAHVYQSSLAAASRSPNHADRDGTPYDVSEDQALELDAHGAKRDGCSPLPGEAGYTGA